MPRFHLQEDLLVDYASGALPTPVSLLVATHLTLCPVCRDAVDGYETIGGALLEEINPVAMAADALEVAFACLETDDIEALETDNAANLDPDDPTAPSIPRALSRVLGGSVETLAWKRRARGIAEVELPVNNDGYSASLLRIEPGAAIRSHTHEGQELTLVLRGAFSDASGHYQRGDVCHATPEVTHAPVADPGEVCLCLAVVDGPLKLTGLVGRMLNPFLKL
jgi:putative transcriptional regulator